MISLDRNGLRRFWEWDWEWGFSKRIKPRTAVGAMSGMYRALRRGRRWPRALALGKEWRAYSAVDAEVEAVEEVKEVIVVS